MHGEGFLNAQRLPLCNGGQKCLLTVEHTVVGLWVRVVETVDSEVGDQGDNSTKAGATAKTSACEANATSVLHG